MVDEADNKFTWVINNFSSLSDEIYSDEFLIGGCKWILLADPKGTQVDCVSLYLEVADHKSLPLGWRRNATISVKVVNQKSEKYSIPQEPYYCWFDEKSPLGLLKTLPLTKLRFKNGGFLVNDELKIVAEVNVLQVIGKPDAATEGSQETNQPMKKIKMEHYVTVSSDNLHKETRAGNETVDGVNGFQVSTSQVAYVRCIFERHPDFASKVRSNNQLLKSTYMNVLLGLIQTLCQLPEKLSDDDLAEASAAVSYVTQVGFKVDWLEKKLDEVKEKKKKVCTGKTELQHMEEELQILTKKCSDLKDLVEKRNADVSAANVALSFDDVV